MTAQCEIAAKQTQGASLGFFERYLTLWVALCIVTGNVTQMPRACRRTSVFVWSNLTDGEPNFTLTQVALNDTIMLFAFALSSRCCSAWRRSQCRGIRCSCRS